MRAGRGTFFKVRVGILLAILAGVLLYAWRDVRSRRARKDWDRPLYVAVVLLESEPLDPEAPRALREKLETLDDRLADQMHRYRAGTAHPFSFVFFGPVLVDRPPPPLGGENATEAAKQAAAAWSYLSGVDVAPGVEKVAASLDELAVGPAAVQGRFRVQLPVRRRPVAGRTLGRNAGGVWII